MSKGKYETACFIGVPVQQNASGAYQITADAKPHTWRTGKHTKGKFKELGQIFLTENQQAIAVVKTTPLAFKDRHEYQPLGRWTTAYLPEQTDLTAYQ
ncbi:DUF7671 family protein [Eupransor demetentiae]|uniref:DUF7671 domain-containing protein n=1 Tax=Eupransor demetentiae TaxID=3109584 RepID=A0ABM9N4G1_9LACO|nr:hypothetical protein R54876_GBNLAHCA_00619 [Lactobacillaceae bacterium LMG 33000]